MCKKTAASVNEGDEFLKKEMQTFRPHWGWMILILQNPSQKTGNNNVE